MRTFDELPEDAKRYARWLGLDVPHWFHAALDIGLLSSEEVASSGFAIPNDCAAFWAEVEYERRQLRARAKRLAAMTQEAQAAGNYFGGER